MQFYVVRKQDQRRAFSLNLGATRANPHVLILQSRNPAERDAQELDDLVTAVAEKRGLDKDAILTKAEEDYRERLKVFAASQEIKRRLEGNGLWKKVGGRWIMR
jgi:hypothetical protein